MTVCKTFTRKPLVKGQTYRKAELICDLEGNERMASTYYDPPRDKLYTFFNEKNEDWINKYEENTGTFRFFLRNFAPLEDAPAWERTKIRHVFLRREKQTDDGYEYLGTAIDEKRVSVGGHDERHFAIQ